MVLLERLSGPMGEAYHWGYGPEAVREIEEKGKGWPFSPSYWLVHLPAHDCQVEDDEVDDLYHDAPGVFQVGYLLHDHEMWAQFRGVLPRFSYAYALNVSEAWGEAPNAANPDSVSDYGEPILGDHGNATEAAAQHMRLWVDALLSGELDPYEGPDDVTWFAAVREKAEADPAAHLRQRTPAPPSNQPALF